MCCAELLNDCDIRMLRGFPRHSLGVSTMALQVRLVSRCCCDLCHVPLSKTSLLTDWELRHVWSVFR